MKFKKKPKYSFIERATGGFGWFRNRQTGKLEHKKIKQEGLSFFASMHFGN